MLLEDTINLLDETMEMLPLQRIILRDSDLDDRSNIEISLTKESSCIKFSAPCPIKADFDAALEILYKLQHVHPNLSVLNTITSGDIDRWNDNSGINLVEELKKSGGVGYVGNESLYLLSNISLDKYDNGYKAYLENFSLDIIPGNTYIVSFDNVKYNVLCVENQGLIILGALAEDDVKTYPFQIATGVSEDGINHFTSIQSIIAAEAVSVSEEVEVIHKINDIYLPEVATSEDILEWMASEGIVTPVCDINGALYIVEDKILVV